MATSDATLAVWLSASLLWKSSVLIATGSPRHCPAPAQPMSTSPRTCPHVNGPTTHHHHFRPLPLTPRGLRTHCSARKTLLAHQTLHGLMREAVNVFPRAAHTRVPGGRIRLVCHTHTHCHAAWADRPLLLQPGRCNRQRCGEIAVPMPRRGRGVQPRSTPFQLGRIGPPTGHSFARGTQNTGCSGIHRCGAVVAAQNAALSCAPERRPRCSSGPRGLNTAVKTTMNTHRGTLCRSLHVRGA